MSFHVRSAISFLVFTLVHSIERGRKRRWSWVIFVQSALNVQAIVRRGPSLAVILGVSRSNKSQVGLANGCRSELTMIHPYRLRSGLDKRPASVVRHERTTVCIRRRIVPVNLMNPLIVRQHPTEFRLAVVSLASGLSMSCFSLAD